MNQQLLDIVVVLDRSGSMSSVLDDTIGGFNTFVDEQKRAEGQARMTLTRFDHEYEIVYERLEIAAVLALDRATFVPRGQTALLDAVGRTISAVAGRIAAGEESDRPFKVVFVILTDGQENASREFTRTQVLEMIREKRERAGWEFVFLGAGPDAVREATAVGIDRDKAASWKSTKEAYELYSKKLTKYRTDRDASGLGFDEEERKKLDDDGTPPKVH